MSINSDSWHKVTSEVPADGVDDDDLVPPLPPKQQQQQQPGLVVSDANLEEGSTGFFLRLRGGLTLFFVVMVWVVGVSESVNRQEKF